MVRDELLNRLIQFPMPFNQGLNFAEDLADLSLPPGFGRHDSVGHCIEASNFALDIVEALWTLIVTHNFVTLRLPLPKGLEISLECATGRIKLLCKFRNFFLEV